MANSRGNYIAFTNSLIVGCLQGGSDATSWTIKDQSLAGTVTTLLAADVTAQNATPVATPPGAPAPGRTVQLVSPKPGPNVQDQFYVVALYAVTPDFPFPFAILESTLNQQVQIGAVFGGPGFGDFNVIPGVR